MMTQSWFFQQLMTLVAPQSISCHSCDRLLLPNEYYLCHSCEERLLRSFIPLLESRKLLMDGKTMAISCCWHEDVARQLIHALKYNHDAYSARPLVDLMIMRYWELKKNLPDKLIAVPVPVHPKRQNIRGYNQSLILVQEFCHILDMPYDDLLLSRNLFTASQVRRSRQQRLEAVKNAFSSEKKLNGENILLIDDVLTTGATVSACAEALYSSGAGNVIVMTVCRSEKG